MTVTVKVDLRGSLGGVRDQGNRPTCLSQATTLAHEHCRGAKVALSPEYLHFFASHRRPANAVNMRDLSAALRTEGQPREVDCPYLPSTPQPGWKPSPKVQVFRRKSAFRSAGGADVRAAIRAGHLPVIAIRLPGPFYDPQAPFIIPAQGTVYTNHAVGAVGIGAGLRGELVLIRNSWGAGWGDQGHAWLDDAFLGQHLIGMLLLTVEVV